MGKLLREAYDTEKFKLLGHRLLDTLDTYLGEAFENHDSKPIRWKKPEESLAFWSDFLENGDIQDFFEEVFKRSTHLHHPGYVGHQVSPAAPVTLLTASISAALNNGTAVYEMGMVTNPMERIITEWLAKKIGYTENYSGFLTSGGTLANLTALLSARKAKVKDDIWNKGHQRPLGILVSEEAHYCIERAAKIMGLGEQGLLKVPVNADFSMDTGHLEDRYHMALQQGIEVFAIVGSAPATATGMFDDLQAIGSFARKYGLWFHVDAAHGGAALFSPKYKRCLRGIGQSDSVVIDGHKMMMMPGITTALVYQDARTSSVTFSQKADYLLEESRESDWYNSGKRTFECTKNMMALHWFVLLKTYGEAIFDEFVTTLFDLGHTFGEMVQRQKHLELAVHPMTNIVCFRYVSPDLPTDALNAINANIRQQLLEDGEFYIVQTKLRGIHYLRITIMNPFTTKTHLKRLLEKITITAETVLSDHHS